MNAALNLLVSKAIELASLLNCSGIGLAVNVGKTKLAYTEIGRRGSWETGHITRSNNSY